MRYADAAEEMVRRIGTIQDEVGASVCFGSPVERDGHTLIPVARVSFGYGMGFGGGSGTDDDNSSNGKGPSAGEGGGGGCGGGGSSTPVAVIDITNSGVDIQPITDSTRIALSGMMMTAWVTFWLFLTVRLIAKEAGKTRRQALDKG